MSHDLCMIASILHDLDWVLPLRTDWLTPLFKAFTHLGYTGFFFAALPLLYWCWEKEKANRLANLTLVAALLMFFLKDFFQDPRPPVEFAMEGYRPGSYGLPSGHTLLAIIFWGCLAMENRNRWFTVASVIMILGIAFSRLYLGVHDLEDVLGGAFLGIFLLLALLLFQRVTRKTGKRLPRLLILLTTLTLPLLLWVIWPENAPPGRFILISSFFLGWQMGKIGEIRYSNSAPVQGRRIPLAAFIGIATVTVVSLILKLLFDVSNAAPLIFQIIGGIAVGMTITWLVPVILVKTKIAQRSNA